MAKKNSAILVHYTEEHKYVLYTQDYSSKLNPVSMVAPFSYNSKDQEEVHRCARAHGLDRAEGLGVKLVEKTEKKEA